MLQHCLEKIDVVKVAADARAAAAEAAEAALAAAMASDHTEPRTPGTPSTYHGDGSRGTPDGTVMNENEDVQGGRGVTPTPRNALVETEATVGGGIESLAQLPAGPDTGSCQDENGVGGASNDGGGDCAGGKGGPWEGHAEGSISSASNGADEWKVRTAQAEDAAAAQCDWIEPASSPAIG